jgi:hypothetical protein
MIKQIELYSSGPISELMRACEIHCVTYCCGVDAFEISEEPIRTWVKTAGLEKATQARQQLETLIEDVTEHSGVVMTDWFYVTWSARECVAWLNEWKTILDEVL